MLSCQRSLSINHSRASQSAASARRTRRSARELADRISDALGHLHRMVRVLDDSFDEFAYGG